MEIVIDKSKCECCNVNFIKKRDYDIHILTKKHQDRINNAPKEICIYCDYKTDKKITLEKHIKSYHKDKINIEPKEKCIYCDYETSKKMALENHIRLNHKEERDKNKPDLDWKKECILCDVIFTSKIQYQKHCMTTKHIEKELGVDKKKCNFCDYKTSKTCTMDRHFRVMHPLEYKLSKVVEKDEKESLTVIPPKIKRLYKSIIDQKYFREKDILGHTNRITNLKNRRFNDEDEKIKDAYYKIDKCEDEIDDLNIKIEKMNKKYPGINKRIKPGLTHLKTSDLIIYKDASIVFSDIDEDDEIDEEEVKRQQIEKQFEEDSLKRQEDLKIKKEKVDEYNIEIEKLQEEYIQSKGDMSIYRKIEKIEKKINELYE
jgi:hypothetical protein